ncbi:unnamed protein product [Durusdinium trenchii]
MKLLLYVLRSAHWSADQANSTSRAVACVLQLLISCTGDLVEYFDEWALVQCAIRGTCFCESAKATYALILCNGLGAAVLGDLLLNSLSTLGCLFCGMIGCGLGALMNSALHPAAATPVWISSLVGGVLAGGTVLRLYSSGSQAMILCWAEKSTPLHESHGFEDIHTELQAKIRESETS